MFFWNILKSSSSILFFCASHLGLFQENHIQPDRISPTSITYLDTFFYLHPSFLFSLSTQGNTLDKCPHLGQEAYVEIGVWAMKILEKGWPFLICTRKTATTIKQLVWVFLTTPLSFQGILTTFYLSLFNVKMDILLLGLFNASISIGKHTSKHS